MKKELKERKKVRLLTKEEVDAQLPPTPFGSSAPGPKDEHNCRRESAYGFHV